MTPKLGEILVAGKVLAPEALKRALDAQLIFGGRLGTNLLELGFLDEATLTKALEQQKRLPVATQQMLEGASKEALRLVPAKVADRHKVIPFELAEKKLKVAMLDPTDLIALDEVQFTTGCQVIPYIAPEVRLLAFLELYYKIPRPLRYIKLADMEPKAQPRVPTATPAPQRAGAAPAEDQSDVSLEDLLASEPMPPAPAATPAPRAPTAPVAPASVQPPEPATVEPPPVTYEDAARMMADAETREDVGDALVGYAQEVFPRVMAFVVQRDRALGWLAHLPGFSPPRARQIVRAVVVPLEQPSVLQTVVVSGTYYMGELPARPGDDLLAAALGNPRPLNVLVMPITLNDQVVTCLYADNADRPMAAFDMRALRSVCQRAGLAMEVLLLKARIRQV